MDSCHRRRGGLRAHRPCRTSQIGLAVALLWILQTVTFLRFQEIWICFDCIAAGWAVAGISAAPLPTASCSRCGPCSNLPRRYSMWSLASPMSKHIRENHSTNLLMLWQRPLQRGRRRSRGRLINCAA